MAKVIARCEGDLLRTAWEIGRSRCRTRVMVHELGLWRVVNRARRLGRERRAELRRRREGG